MYDLSLERVRGIACECDSIHVEDDVHTNTAFVGSVSVYGSKATYLEGSSILTGTDVGNESTHSSKTEKPSFRAELSCTNAIDNAVLLSAHFVSVSTAPEATDKGIAS